MTVEPKLMSAERLAKLEKQTTQSRRPMLSDLLAHIAAQDRRIAELEAGLREAVGALDGLTMLDPMTDEPIEPAEGERLVRLRKLLPSEET